MKRVLVLGGYGTFGTQVCRQLARSGVPLTVAGRRLVQANKLARQLGGDSVGLAVDVTRRDDCRRAIAGHGVVVHCAGPYRYLEASVLEACLDNGCHYADIADDRRYVTLVRALDERFRRAGLTAAYGCSSLPGISGALAVALQEGSHAAVERVRVTLFIGNDNPKGAAAIRSLVEGLGRPITAPQGMLLGFHDREVVSLPAPFGRRGVFTVESPEYDLFPELLGARAVAVKVGFESRLGTYAFALLARWPWGHGSGTARLLERACTLVSRFGCSGGAILTEIFRSDGTAQRAALLARQDGQLMAALPCAWVAQALAGQETARHGAVTAYEFLGARGLLERLTSVGFELLS